MTKVIGPREQALRDMRAQETKPIAATPKVRAELAAKLPETSGIKPIKKKRVRRKK